MRMNRAEYDANRRPAVYEVFYGTLCLYVGSGKQGLQRVYDIHQAKHLTRLKAFEMMTHIEVTFCDTYEQAAQEEIRLIHECHPLYNRACALCGRCNIPWSQRWA